MDKHAGIWSKWSSKHIETRTALVWSDIEVKIEVVGVKRPDLPEGFQFHTTAPTLTPEDRKP